MSPSFLPTPETTDEVQALYDEDVEDLGFVMNASRLWAHDPSAFDALFALLHGVTKAAGLTVRERGILVTACASTLGDSYCSAAWGYKLTAIPEAGTDAATVAAILRGHDHGLTSAEHAMADWARRVARDPNGTTAADVQALRDEGFDDARIFAITVFVAGRIAFSTVNDALGALPDAGLRALAPGAVLDAITYGRPFGERP